MSKPKSKPAKEPTEYLAFRAPVSSTVQFHRQRKIEGRTKSNMLLRMMEKQFPAN